ncbi:MAG: transcription termination factor NusA [Candidatus Berkelbacteria bacterium]|nr:transcription termination factor NusA [Candidatus Berkelbacteria bacterium]
MAISPFLAAMNQICDEKGLAPDLVLETVEAALAAAYRKDYGHPDQIIKVKLNPENEDMKFSEVFEVVEKVENEHREITLKDAKKIKKGIKVGETIEKELTPAKEFGRIAAQTAKQVIVQRLKEAEKTILYDEYKEKEGQILTGVVQQIEGKNILVNLGKLNGIMFSTDQIPYENYHIGQRLKVYAMKVEDTPKGPNILLSRAHPNFIPALFAQEVPEIAQGTVKVMATTREPGSRTKMAVIATQEGVDPVGSCVGQRGTRVSTVLAEISDEKIDIVLWNAEPEKYIQNALSPAKIEKVKLFPKKKDAKVSTTEDQLSLAIGKNGQNVRLASKLTGWTLDIIKEGKPTNKKEEAQEKKEEPAKKETKKTKKSK